MAYNQRYNPDALPAYVLSSSLPSLSSFSSTLSRALLTNPWRVIRTSTGRATKG
jgi:hypothetical protein